MTALVVMLAGKIEIFLLFLLFNRNFLLDKHPNMEANISPI